MSPFYEGSSALSDPIYESSCLSQTGSCLPTSSITDVSGSDSFLAKHDAEVKIGSTAGKEKIGSVGERALTAAGLHLSEGGKVWQAFR